MPQLLISNCTTDPAHGGVYLLETETGASVRIHDQASRGMTIAPHGIFVVGNRGGVHRIDPQSRTSTPCAELPVNGSHDLRWMDGEFLLVASYGNRILRLDRDFRILDQFNVVEDEGDVCHANCIVRDGDRLLLSVFTLTSGRREEKRYTREWREDGKVLEIDWSERRYTVVADSLSQPHSLLPEDGEVYCCESLASRIVALDLASNRRRVLREDYGFVRGLALTGGRAYAGVSRVRARVPFAQYARGLFRMRCGVIEYDSATWKPLRRFPIPGSEVYEILVLGAEPARGSE